MRRCAAHIIGSAGVTCLNVMFVGRTVDERAATLAKLREILATL